MTPQTRKGKIMPGKAGTPSDDSDVVTTFRRFYSAEELIRVLGDPIQGIQIQAATGLPTNLIGNSETGDR